MSPPPATVERTRAARVLRRLAVAIAAYLVVAYVVLPTLWRHYEHLPAMASMPTTTRAPNGLPGDALNVALVGSESQIQRAFRAAGWKPADPLTLRSSLGIAASVVLDRPDEVAPVSNLLLFGRRQDLAFEKEVGKNARERNHVRFWQTELHADDGWPVWLGAATFDRGVGLSHTTGQITHHVSPDIDAERDTLMRDLSGAGQLVTRYDVTGIGPTVNGRNGGGDRYFTDGELAVGVLAADGAVGGEARRLADPPTVVIKNQFWSWLRPVLVEGTGSAAVGE